MSRFGVFCLILLLVTAVFDAEIGAALSEWRVADRIETVECE
jgi:hypothetical protein